MKSFSSVLSVDTEVSIQNDDIRKQVPMICFYVGKNMHDSQLFIKLVFGNLLLTVSVN